MNTERWNVAVSADMDKDLRMFLASQGGDRDSEFKRPRAEPVPECAGRVLDGHKTGGRNAYTAT